RKILLVINRSHLLKLAVVFITCSLSCSQRFSGSTLHRLEENEHIAKYVVQKDTVHLRDFVNVFPNLNDNDLLSYGISEASKSNSILKLEPRNYKIETLTIKSAIEITGVSGEYIISPVENVQTFLIIDAPTGISNLRIDGQDKISMAIF